MKLDAQVSQSPAIDTFLDRGISLETQEKQMKSYRDQLRNILLPIIYDETNLLVKIQNAIRHPVLDTFFVRSSALGNHNFFVLILPLSFWFGYATFARGLALIVSMGVILTAFIKDLLCLPRPRSPPVQRLITTYHLEYGLPSTHTTNSVSIALFCLSYLLASNNMNLWIKYICIAGLFIYCASIVIGRVYCGMHGLYDVAAGIIIGILIWWAQITFQKQIDDFILSDSLFVPTSTILSAISLIYFFPEPIDKCPCIEDCISCIGVAIGMIVGCWRFSRTSYSLPNGNVLYDYNSIGFSMSCARVILGSSVIFSFRIVMKKLLHIILQPIYSCIFNDGSFSTKKQRCSTTKIQEHKQPGKKFRINEPSVKLTARCRKIDRPFKFTVDAAVKLIVYSGIAWLATDGIPVLFEILGMGVKFDKESDTNFRYYT